MEGVSTREKFLAPLKKHPLIPAGMVATCGALAMAFRRLHQRDSPGYQRWLRARVLAQGFTIVAIVAAGVQEWGTGAFTGMQGKTVEGKLVTTSSPSDKLAFEKRLRDAEETHAIETTLTSDGNTFGQNLRREGQSAPSSVVDRQSPGLGSATAPPKPSSSSWLSWLGLSKG